MPDPQQGTLTREQAIARLQELYDKSDGKVPEKYKSGYKKLIQKGIIDPTRRFGEGARFQEDTSELDSVTGQFERSPEAQNKSVGGFIKGILPSIGHTALGVAKGMAAIPPAVIGSRVSAIQSIMEAQRLRGLGDYQGALDQLDEARTQNEIPWTMAKDFLGGGTGITNKAGALAALRYQASDQNETPEVRALAKRQADKLQTEILQGVGDMTYENPAQQLLNVTMVTGPVGKMALGQKAAGAVKRAGALTKEAQVAEAAGDSARAAELTAQADALRASASKTLMQREGLTKAEHNVMTGGIPKAIGAADRLLTAKSPKYASAKAAAASALVKPIGAGRLSALEGKKLDYGMRSEFEDMTDPAFREQQQYRIVTDQLSKQVQDAARRVKARKQGAGPTPEPLENPTLPPSPDSPVLGIDPKVDPATGTPVVETPLGGSVDSVKGLIPEGEGSGKVTITKGIEDAEGNLINPTTSVEGGPEAPLGGTPIQEVIAKKTRGRKTKTAVDPEAMSEPVQAEVVPQTPEVAPQVSEGTAILKKALAAQPTEELLARRLKYTTDPQFADALPLVEEVLASRGITGEPTVKPVETPQAAPVEQPVTGFTTAKGSTYQVLEDGTTIRDKAPRADAGHEGDSGVKPQTSKTVYVPAEEAPNLSAAGLTGAEKSRVGLSNGKATLFIWNEQAGKWGRQPSGRDVPYSDVPREGLSPLELWEPRKDVPGHDAYSGMHAGNPITEIRRGSAEPVKQPAPAYDPAQLKPGEESYLEDWTDVDGTVRKRASLDAPQVVQDKVALQLARENLPKNQQALEKMTAELESTRAKTPPQAGLTAKRTKIKELQTSIDYVNRRVSEAQSRIPELEAKIRKAEESSAQPAPVEDGSRFSMTEPTQQPAIEPVNENANLFTQPTEPVKKTGKSLQKAKDAISGAGGAALSILPFDITNPGTAAAAAIAGVAGLVVLKSVAKFAKSKGKAFAEKLRTDAAAATKYDSLLSEYIEARLPREVQADIDHAAAMEAYKQRRAQWNKDNPGELYDEPMPERPQLDPPTEAEVQAVRQKVVDALRSDLELKQLTPEEKAQGLAPEDAIAHEFTNLGDNIVQQFDRLGQELVDFGLIDEKAYGANKGRYLRRIYQFWEDPEGFMQGMESSLREAGVPEEQIRAELALQKRIYQDKTGRAAEGVEMTGTSPSGRLSKRKLSARKLTDADTELRDFLGEIGLSSIRVRRGGEIASRELSKAMLTQSVAEKFSVSSKRARQLDQIRSDMTETGQKPDESMFQNLAERTFYYHPEIFKQVRQTDNLKGLGHLEDETFYGDHIPASILKSLTEGEWRPTNALEKYMLLWKVSKTAYNLPSWIGNVFGNVELAFLGGGMNAFNPRLYQQATESIRNRDDMFRLAMQHSDHPYESIRMEITTRRHLDPKTVYPDNPTNLIRHKAQDFHDALTDAYGGIDSVFKHALFMDTVEKLGVIDPTLSMNEKAALAAKQVANTFPNFRQGTPVKALRPTVRKLRRSAVPFLSWDASVIPLAARLFMEHPSRVAFFPNVYRAYEGAIEDYTAKHGARNDMTGKEAYDEEKRSLPDYMRGYIRLPIRGGKAPGEEEDNTAPFYMDSSPANALTGLDAANPEASPLDALLQRINPILAALDQVRVNRKAGTEIPVANPGGTEMDKARQRAGFLAQQLIPGATQAGQVYRLSTGTSATPKMVDDGEGGTKPTYQLDKGERVRQAAAMLRVNVKKVDLPKEIISKRYGLRDDRKDAISAIRQQLKAAEAQKGSPLTEKEQDAIVEPLVNELNRKVGKVVGTGGG